MPFGRTGGLLVVAVAMVVAITVPAQGQDGADHLDPDFIGSIDQAVVHGTITPPGARMLDFDSERIAYDDLVYGYRDLTADELTTTYFKDGRFGVVEDPIASYRPRQDVLVVRDEWGVPHIYGDTDEAAAFGAGYAGAEDRLPVMEALRALGRAEAFELLGDNASWLADAEIVRLYGYTDAEFQQMLDRMPALYGQEGQDLVDLLDAEAAGINHFVLQAQQGQVPLPIGLADLIPPNEIAPWSAKDIVAVVSIVRALFGADGGGELATAARWLDLVDTYGEQPGRDVYEDFRNRLNDDGPMHTLDERFSFNLPAVDGPTAGNAMGFGPGDPGLQGLLEELGSVLPTSAGAAAADLQALHDASAVDWDALVLDLGPGGTVDLSRGAQASMSNFLAVGPSRAEGGLPILLGGPQAGYLAPQILVENVLHSPTIHAAGAGFAGLSLVVIGRNERAAWTATAGGSDMIDTYVEVLCDPDGGTVTEEEVHYLFDTDGDGEPECIPMDVRLHRETTTLPGGEVLPAIYVERTIHGPVAARGRLGDVAVAVSRKRSTYLKELDPGISILRMNRGVDTAEGFIDAFATGHNLATNWGFVSDDEVAYFHGGLFPYRPDTIHPDFPVWGTGAWEWQRAPEGSFDADAYYPATDHPHEIDPDRDYLVSWNNRQAPNWGEDDSGWGFSSVYRADLLEDQIIAEGEAGRLIDPVRLTQLMEHAGLSDLRGTHVLPLVMEVLDAAAAPSPRAQQMRDLLVAWMEPEEDYAWGALRRDADRDGAYEHEAAIAIIDAWWANLVETVFAPALGRPVTSVSRQGIHDAPGPIGSAFQGGFYGQVRTDLELVLGHDRASPTSQVYCGSDAVGVDGTLTACAQRLWASLDAIGTEVADAQGTEDPAAWSTDAQAERITFTFGAVPAQDIEVIESMHWVNRPTTQVLAQFGEPTPTPMPEPEPSGTDTTEPEGPTLPATGGGLALMGLIGVAVGAFGRRRRGRGSGQRSAHIAGEVAVRTSSVISGEP